MDEPDDGGDDTAGTAGADTADAADITDVMAIVGPELARCSALADRLAVLLLPAGLFS